MPWYRVQSRGPGNSDHRQNFKNALCTFCCIEMKGVCAKSQLSIFKNVGGDRGDVKTTPPTPIHACGKMFVL